MGDISNETPLTTGLGSSNNVFQEQIKDGNESPLDKSYTPLIAIIFKFLINTNCDQEGSTEA